MFQSCTSASSAPLTFEPERLQRSVHTARGPLPSASINDNPASLNELLKSLKDDDWITGLHEVMLNQPNLGSVISAIAWILPVHAGEVLALSDLKLLAHEEHLRTTPEMCTLNPDCMARPSAQPTARQSKDTSLLARVGNVFTGLANRSAPSGSGTTHNDEQPTPNATGHLPPNTGLSPYLHEAAVLFVFEHLARQAGLPKSWPQQAEAHIIRNPAGRIDISPVFRDAVLERLHTLVLQNPQSHDTDYRYFEFLKTNSSIDALLSGISCLESSNDNQHHLPLPVRIAILTHAPQCVPLLSTARQMLHIAGQKATPPLQRFTLFEYADPQIKQALVNRPEGAYAPTFITGIERLIGEEGQKPQWRIVQPEGHSLQTDNFSDVLVAVARNAVTHSLTGNPPAELPVWHWPLSLHQAATAATGQAIPATFFEAEQTLCRHIQSNRELAEKKAADFRQEEQRRQAVREEKERALAAEIKAERCYTPETLMMTASSPWIGVAQLSDTYAHVFTVPETSLMSPREWVLDTLGKRFDRLEVSHLMPATDGECTGADNLCWMRSGFASVLAQLHENEDVFKRLGDIGYPKNLQYELAFLLIHLRALYAENPDACFGQTGSERIRPIHITPGMTAGDLHTLTRSNWPLDPKSARKNIERALAFHNAYFALAFRFESSTYAAEVANLLPLFKSGAGAELPLALHRCLCLPAMIIEHNAAGPTQLTVRAALPKDHPLHSEWEHLSAALEKASETEKAQILQHMLDRFSGLPVLYLESLTKMDSIGHYTLYMPRAGLKPAAPPQGEQASTHPAPLTNATHQHQRWTSIKEGARQERSGIADRDNVNSSGFEGLNNSYQVKRGVRRFNAHHLALKLDSRGHPIAEPFTFAQSPDKHGAGTAASALPWLELAMETQAPIFQFVHPKTLRDGAYKSEQSLITLLNEELKHQSANASRIHIHEIKSPRPRENNARTRHFQVHLQWHDADRPHQATFKKVDITLCAAELHDGVISSRDLSECATVFNAVSDPYYASNPDTRPIVMSTGGFGRSSCLGVYQSVTRRVHENAISLQDALDLTDQMVMSGKAVRGSHFVPSFQQYLQLRAAIESYWRAQNTQGATTFLT